MEPIIYSLILITVCWATVLGFCRFHKPETPESKDIRYIGQGGDYATWTAAFADIPADLTGNVIYENIAFLDMTSGGPRRGSIDYPSTGDGYDRYEVI